MTSLAFAASSARPVSRAAWAAVLLLVVCAWPAQAQDPAPTDTVPARPDTVVVPAPPERVAEDTIVVPIPPERVAQDTIPVENGDTIAADLPAPNLPVFSRAPADGFAFGRWEWDQQALAQWHGMSLLALLEQVPGLLVTRGGWYGRPAGVAAFGSGGGRVRVFLDGFELAPLESAVFDVQHVGVVDLETVRVERTLAETRIELFSFRQPSRRPFSQIEAGTSLFRTRILRGLFSTTVGTHSVLALGLDITDSDGWLGQQPFSTNALFARWTYGLTENTGLQLEYRQASLERVAAPYSIQGERRDLVFRARSLPLPGLSVDVVGGRSWRTPGDVDTLDVDLESLQGAVRARLDLAPAWLGAAARVRGGGGPGYAAPDLELSAEAGLRPLPWLLASGEVRNARADGISGTELQGGVRLGPLAGLSVFANAATGTRPLGFFFDTVPQIVIPQAPRDRVVTFSPFASRLRGFRAGAEWTGWGARLGGAYVSHDLDSVAPFALAFDWAMPPVAAEAVSGLEGYLSVPLGTPLLRVHGSYTRWNDAGGRPYLPLEQGRAGFTFSGLFYDGNLEPTLRAEAVRRGGALVPSPEAPEFGAVSPSYSVFNVFLQIRILDVQAFLIWDHLLHTQVAADLAGPGRSLGGQRAIYGVRWHFFD